MYRSLGGIAPLSAGYATVSIAPQISKTLGPSGVRAAVNTVRGRVASNWTRHSEERASADGCFVELSVSVPVGVAATVQLPLLGRDAAVVTVDEAHFGRLWGGGAAGRRPHWLRAVPLVSAGFGGDDGALLLEVAAGEFVLRGCERLGAA